ncbi:MAG: hypothetical protein LLF98_01870 [Clostridium sp.]|uniref:hypothetical protein n=1 Tax=Clostridium sp. TaxID=1506 RepID=UPI0025C32D49|nr:hypothetical protein [Clostridium sp.]MCE5220028.1 hypothetical protein [Clostridium sp.]
MFYNILQLTGGIITSIGVCFQIYKTIKSKSVKDISFINYLSLLIGISMMEAYGFHWVLTNGSGLAFLITNSASLLLSFCMVILILIYRNKK